MGGGGGSANSYTQLAGPGRVAGILVQAAQGVRKNHRLAGDMWEPYVCLGSGCMMSHSPAACSQVRVPGTTRRVLGDAGTIVTIHFHSARGV